VEQRCGTWRRAVVEVALGRVLDGPELLAGVGLEAAEAVELVEEFAVGDDDVLARGCDAAEALGRQRRFPGDLRLVGEFGGEPGNPAVAVRAAPAGPIGIAGFSGG